MSSGRAVVYRLAVMFVLTVCLAGCSKQELTVTLTQEDLQQRLESHFPIERSALLTTVSLSNPRVLLRDGSDRISLTLNSEIKVPLLTALHGTATASGVPRYDPSAKAFFLDQVTVDALQVPGLTPEHEPAARVALSKVAAEVLATKPVYELRDRNLKEAGAAFVLLRVRIQNAALEAHLGLP